ncbi:MAG: ParB N-terminal domain-containing protein [Desulfobacteraceae bacterium]|nr:ParB N-terminal domain-containing protein [Desulfobacteraceae bacterium]MCF8094202.1 ParB N-terminal domain-containing protein [Desulfobacteraceae bacterium]
MQAEHTAIDTAFIDLSDKRYLFTDQRGIDTLADSVGRVGLINPPILQMRQNGDYRVVSGFRRVSACIRLNFRQIPARTIGSEADFLYCIRIAVADNASARALSLAEQRRLVEKLYDLCGSKEAVSSALDQIGVFMPGELVEKFIRISTLPPAVQEGYAENYISLNTALAMESMSRASAEAVARLFEILRPTVNRQKEILGGLNDLAGRQGITIESVLRSREFADILEAMDIDRGRRMHLLRSEIYKRRYPALSSAEAEFFRHKNNLGLEEGMDLKPPQNFEDTTYTVILRFSSTRQLCCQAETLGRICRNPDLEVILKREIEDQQDLY